MSVLTNEIKSLANQVDAQYIRAISLEDFNQVIKDFDLAKPTVVLVNVPEIENKSFESHTSIISEVKLDILFVQKNLDPDDSGDTIQAILDCMETVANKFYDVLYRSTIISKAQKPTGFSLLGTGDMPLTDERVSGWLMTVTVPLDRKVIQC